MVEVRKGVDVAPLRVEPDPKKQIPTVTWSSSIPVHLSMDASPLAIGDGPPNHVTVSVAPDHEKVVLVDDNGTSAVSAVGKNKLSSTCDNLWLFLSTVIRKPPSLPVLCLVCLLVFMFLISVFNQFYSFFSA